MGHSGLLLTDDRQAIERIQKVPVLILAFPALAPVENPEPRTQNSELLMRLAFLARLARLSCQGVPIGVAALQPLQYPLNGRGLV